MEFELLTEFLDKAVCDVPDKIGFVDETGQMSYKQMQDMAYKVAHSILNLVSNKKGNIAILMPSGINEVACIHGVVYSQNAFSCIDDKMPTERVLKIIDMLNPVILITDENTKEKAKNLGISCPLLIYENCYDAEATWVQASDAKSDDVAGIIFTSGSTGKPKGVIHSHKSLISVALSYRDDIGVKEDDRMGIQSPLYYGLGIHNTFIALSAKVCSYYIPKIFFSQPIELVKYLINNKISLVYWSTNAAMIASRFSIWEGFEDELSKTLRVFSFAGDIASTKLVNKMRTALPSVKYYQGYGETEYFYNFYFPIDGNINDDAIIPIGFPGKYVTAYILTDNEKLYEISSCDQNKQCIEGQLCIEGSGLSLGYLLDEEGSAAKYRKHPLKEDARLFYTGDMVELNENNEVIFKTRKDFMVKMMGHRIELGEIEITACSLDDTMQCACVFDKSKDKIIMAYVGKFTEKELKKMLKEKLPAHMIPREIIRFDQLPLNPNNKIDRIKLKEICIK